MRTEKREFSQLGKALALPRTLTDTDPNSIPTDTNPCPTGTNPCPTGTNLNPNLNPNPVHANRKEGISGLGVLSPNINLNLNPCPTGTNPSPNPSLNPNPIHSNRKEGIFSAWGVARDG